MYADHTATHIVGQILVAVLFLGTALINSTTKVRQHGERMAALGVPLPFATLWAGFAIQYTGAILVLRDFQTELGVYLLLFFTVAASAIFHQFWQIDDPLRRHLHLSFVFSNIGIVGALLLLL